MVRVGICILIRIGVRGLDAFPSLTLTLTVTLTQTLTCDVSSI
jgi:hypothetical protein